MAVYVDEAIWQWRGRRWCHLTADSEAELYAFAPARAHRAWFQSRPGRPWLDDYDITERQRRRALALTIREAAEHTWRRQEDAS